MRRGWGIVLVVLALLAGALAVARDERVPAAGSEIVCRLMGCSSAFVGDGGVGNANRFARPSSSSSGRGLEAENRLWRVQRFPGHRLKIWAKRVSFGEK